MHPLHFLKSRMHNLRTLLISIPKGCIFLHPHLFFKSRVHNLRTLLFSILKGCIFLHPLHFLKQRMHNLCTLLISIPKGCNFLHPLHFLKPRMRNLCTLPISIPKGCIFASPPLSQTEDAQSVTPPNLNPKRMQKNASTKPNPKNTLFLTPYTKQRNKRKGVAVAETVVALATLQSYMRE